MLIQNLSHALLALKSERGVSAAEYAVMAVGLVGLIAICGQMIAAWFVPTLAAVSGVIGGG